MRIIVGFFVFASYAQFSAMAQTTFWRTTAVPTVAEDNDTTSVTLGLKFYSDVPGSISGLRFYKGPHNVGTHIGDLWSNTGTKLATVSFTGETASGWQQALFSTPVPIAANTVYVISYLAPQGRYADDQYYGWTSLSASPLHVSGNSPGVYAPGSTSTFPTNTWNGSNYWVDPLFVAATPAPPSGGSTFWTTSAIPSTPDVTSDSASVNLGLKFYSDVAGQVTGIRFYKGSGNLGTHVGTLWSSTGTKLSELTFSAETASGWQQATFASPINITANTTYVVSYLAPIGNYAVNLSYPWSGLSATPLHVSGSAPGVYAYASAPTFPTNTWSGSNYWVDLVFAASTSSSPSLYSISGVVTGSAATLSLSGGATASTTTDSTGKYTFSGLANGSYSIAAAQAGYTFTPATASVTLNGAALTGVNFTATAVTAVSHSVSLSWTPSTSSNVVGYTVYRGTVAGGPYAQIAFVGGTSYVDNSVSSGQTYFYVATAVDTTNAQSAYSNQAGATVPLP